MRPNRNIITVYVQYENEIHELKTFTNEYRNLMELIFNKIFTEDFGDCKGIGRCGTCLIEILDNPEIAAQRYGNETSTIKKLYNTPNNARLSCQIQVENEINNLHCKVIKT